MSHMRSATAGWPKDLQGYSIGKDGYLLVSFNEGENWYEIETAKDVTMNFTTSTIDTSCRRSGMYKESLPSLIEMSIDAEMLFDKNDPVVMQLLAESQQNGIFRLGCFTDNGNGPIFYAHATDFGRPEELEGVVRVSAKYALVRFVAWLDGLVDAEGVENSNHPIKKLPTGKVESVITTNSSNWEGENILPSGSST